MTGRVRLRVPAARRSPRLAAALADALADLPGVFQVRVSRVSGSVLVRCGVCQTADTLVLAVEAEGVRLGRWVEAAPAPAPPDEAGRDRWDQREAAAVVDAQRTDPEAGLSAGEADRRLARHGSNLIPSAVRRSSVAVIRDQLLSLPMAVIVTAVLLSLTGGGTGAALLALGVALANASIGAAAEIGAERSLDRVRADVDLRAGVLRDSTVAEIPFADFVPGDILDLHSGTRVPADARIIRAAHLLVDESTLTGESVPVPKSADARPRRRAPISQQGNMVFRGTLVVQGNGRAVVVATGGRTVIGRLQRFLGAVVPPEAVIARDLRQMTGRMARIGAAAVAVFGAAALVGRLPWHRIVRDAMAIMTVALPSGLSTAAASAFALGHRDLRHDRVLVRRLRALSGLASVQVVCFDKTGTLTLNRMRVAAVSTPTASLSLVPPGDDAPVVAAALGHTDIRWLIRTGVLCNAITVSGQADNPSLEGSSTERALVELARRTAMDPDTLAATAPVLETAFRTDQRQLMVTRHGGREGSHLVAVKGSPLEVLERCSGYRRQGRRVPLGEAVREQIAAENDRMAGAGLRVLGLAYRRTAPSRPPAPLGDVSRLTWAGLVGIADPLRPGARRLVQTLHRAGIRTVVITGDQSLTAQHIGERLDIGGGDPLRILDASDIRALGQGGLGGVVTRSHVFARLGPSQKLDVVQAYQASGLNVAMVGDGFNDVLALKAADVGFAMGREGAGLACQTADLVLEDDDLGRIATAIASGRSFYGKVEAGMRFLLTGSQVELMAELPARTGLTPAGPGAWQGLWANLVCLALAAAPLPGDPLAQPPRPPSAPLLDAAAVRRTTGDALRITAAAAATGGYGLVRHGRGETANDLFLQASAAGNLLSAASSPREGPPPGQGSPRRRWLEATLAAAVGGNLVAWLARGGRLMDLPALAAAVLWGRRLLAGSTR